MVKQSWREEEATVKWFMDLFLKDRKATKMLKEVTPDNIEEKLEEWKRELGPAYTPEFEATMREKYSK